MTAPTLNRIACLGALVCPLAAFGLVSLAIVARWAKPEPDEGALAHLFQLLVGAGSVSVLVFAATADWRTTRSAAVWLALQLLALATAVIPVAVLKL